MSASKELASLEREIVSCRRCPRLVAWREGDIDGIREGMAAEIRAKYPKLYQHINVDRNDAWLPKIEQRLAAGEDDTLLVVGALHTLGEDGIVHKLEARGYKVERICSACSR